jgi:hypothetical protein
LRSLDPALDIGPNWDNWVKFILTMSPAMRTFTRENPLMYPFLARILDSIESPATG